MSKKKTLKKMLVLFVLFLVCVLFIWRGIFFSSFSADFKMGASIASQLILAAGALAVMKKSGRPFSCYGIFYDDIFVEIGWGVLAGTAWNFFLQGRIFPDSVSLARILTALLPAVWEELVWRGYMPETLKELIGRPGCAVFLTALGFSCLHAIDVIDPLQLAAAFGLGMLWGFLRLRKNFSVFFFITMHFLIDLI